MSLDIMNTRVMTSLDIEDQFGPFAEIPSAADGGWDFAAIEAARASNLLWTRTDPGLISTGYHFVNRQCYLRAAVPYTDGADIVEVDPDIIECPTCGDILYDGAPCEHCPGTA